MSKIDSLFFNYQTIEAILLCTDEFNLLKSDISLCWLYLFIKLIIPSYWLTTLMKIDNERLRIGSVIKR